MKLKPEKSRNQAWMGFKPTILIPPISQRSWVQIPFKPEFFFHLHSSCVYNWSVMCSEVFCCLFFLSGCIGIVDYDTVEMSNLHRQVLHTESRVNISKAESIKMQMNQWVTVFIWVILHLFFQFILNDKINISFHQE